jgi:hypothetical protein
MYGVSEVYGIQALTVEIQWCNEELDTDLKCATELEKEEYFKEHKIQIYTYRADNVFDLKLNDPFKTDVKLVSFYEISNFHQRKMSRLVNL